MRTVRIYQNTELKNGITIQLNSCATNHITNVLRLSENDPLIIFNGRGGEYSAEISSAKKHKVLVVIKNFYAIEKESPLKIHLAQGISRGEKMDFTIQKAVELGVTSIIPIITERCGIKLAKERWDKKLEHWQKIIIGACEQCGRNVLPKLNETISLPDFLQKTSQSFDESTPRHKQESKILKLILDPLSEDTLSKVKNTSNEIILLIGSEGGLSDDEIKLAEKGDFKGVKLGPRILRTETAGVATIAIVQSMWGDLGS